MNTVKFCDIYALVLPLGHSIGRVGCHFSGCCYGVSYDGRFSCTYIECIGNAPLNTPLLPIQLIEAFILTLLFFVLLIIFLNAKQIGLVTIIYIYSYSVIRFILEFFRGDTERGVFLKLATSQIISLILIAVASAYMIYKNITKIHQSHKKTEY